MKLLKITLISVLALTISSSAKAQIYINVGVGYGLPAFRNLVAVEYSSTPSSDTYTGVYSSYGKGLQPELTLGYKLNPHFGLELGYGFLIGSKIVADINDGSTTGFTEAGEQELSARMSRIIVGGRVLFGEGDVHPHMRMGLVLGMGAKITETTSTTTTGPSFNSTFERTDEYTGGVAVGFTGGLGITYHFSDMFGIYFDAGLIAQNYSPQNSVITTYNVDGQDQLGSMTTRQKETEYVDSYTDSGSPNDGAPDQDLKFYLPMSSWGLTVGMHFYFGE